MGFDLSETLRSLKPQRHVATIERRPDEDPPWVAKGPAIGGPLFLDTGLYLEVLACTVTHLQRLTDGQPS
ncbi:hypothetical protein E0H35_04895 [Rhizobium leguminosarum bv. viciae]|uniref:Uncharacterized protein n=1 Tax=Rhizobium leguminosarum bv. viciae TaxID=387 RepID=A0A8G2MT99_RHILV|nr:hypothetical protein [Rhizobium leguminosarum bv. viciae]NKK19838.1 hypothetical protein [Rhizobium leguminosarum bv. viciae]NKK49677.1 hypothetical protein [Rhizobium leguminosarum bv. viciae]TBX96653.1 hypothetical protein E0H31_05245 [Rhizobium leguminosarum bv. viciae]TBZ04450.1 hypothetical protein E0H35_04895 [Rhizobium leguminosarum bv. viciae]